MSVLKLEAMKFIFDSVEIDFAGTSVYRTLKVSWTTDGKFNIYDADAYNSWEHYDSFSVNATIDYAEASMLAFKYISSIGRICNV